MSGFGMDDVMPDPDEERQRILDHYGVEREEDLPKWVRLVSRVSLERMKNVREGRIDETSWKDQIGVELSLNEEDTETLLEAMAQTAVATTAVMGLGPMQVMMLGLHEGMALARHAREIDEEALTDEL